MTVGRFIVRHPDVAAIVVLVVGYPIVHVVLRVLA